jgi:hypothetical protein
MHSPVKQRPFESHIPAGAHQHYRQYFKNINKIISKDIDSSLLKPLLSSKDSVKLSYDFSIIIVSK